MILWFYDSIKLDATLQMQPHQCAAERNNNFSHSARCAFANLNWDEVGLYHCEGTLLSHVELLVQQDPKELFCRAVSQSASPQPVLVPGVTSSQVEEFALALVKLRKILAGTVLQPIAVPLNYSPACLPACQLLPPWFGVILEAGDSMMLSLINLADEQDGLCIASP